MIFNKRLNDLEKAADIHPDETSVEYVLSRPAAGLIAKCYIGRTEAEQIDWLAKLPPAAVRKSVLFLSGVERAKRLKLWQPKAKRQPDILNRLAICILYDELAEYHAEILASDDGQAVPQRTGLSSSEIKALLVTRRWPFPDERFQPFSGFDATAKIDCDCSEFEI